MLAFFTCFLRWESNFEITSTCILALDLSLVSKLYAVHSSPHVSTSIQAHLPILQSPQQNHPIFLWDAQDANSFWSCFGGFEVQATTISYEQWGVIVPLWRFIPILLKIQGNLCFLPISQCGNQDLKFLTGV